jgi:hypothetical protein
MWGSDLFLWFCSSSFFFTIMIVALLCIVTVEFYLQADPCVNGKNGS